MTHLTRCALAALFVLTAPALAGAEPNPILEKLIPPELIMRHQAEIGLTSKQKDTLRTALKAAESAAIDLKFKLQAEVEKLTKMMDAPQIPLDKALSQADRVLAVEGQLKRARLTLLIKARNMLTAEQRKTLEAKHREHLRRRRPPRRPGPPR